MKSKRLIAFGTLVWFLIFSLFGLLNFLPLISQDETLQGLIVGLSIVPFATWGAKLYYKKGGGHGLLVGTLMMLVAMLLDAIITVPLIEMPLHGRDHIAFFTYPLLWILIIENVLVIYLYWLFKVKPQTGASLA